MKRIVIGIYLCFLFVVSISSATTTVNNTLNNPFSQASSVPASGISGTVSLANGGTNSTSFTAPASGVNAIPYFDGTRLVTDPVPADFGYNAASGIASFNTIQAASSVSGTQFTSTVATGTAPLVVSSTTPVANLTTSNNALLAGSTAQPFGTSILDVGTANATNYVYKSTGNAASTGALIVQAGGGSGGFGGSLFLGSHANATHPGWVIAGISAGSSGKFTVQNSALGVGTDVFTVDISGAVTATGLITANAGIGPLLITTGAVANQLRTAQTTPPTCTTNCGTGGAVVGTDTAGKVTIGATGTPASGVLITFNGTWAAAPACTAVATKAGMTAFVQIAAATTTTLTLSTAAAPANSDTYSYNCIGVQ